MKCSFLYQDPWINLSKSSLTNVHIVPTKELLLEKLNKINIFVFLLLQMTVTQSDNFATIKSYLNCNNKKTKRVVVPINYPN